MKDLFDGVYKDKKVLITGHTGFKGSWLSIWLNELGAEVIGYALDPYTEKDNFVLAKLTDKIRDIRGDIRDYKKLEETFKKYNPEIVFHLAAQPLVKESYKNPVETYETNVMGTVNVLENCRKSKSVKSVLNVTTDKCYENKEWLWGYRENDRLGGHDPYSASKACSEFVTSSYNKSFFNDSDKALSSARAGNVMGGGDWREHRLIPDCIGSLSKGDNIKIRNPHAIRPWQFVLEPLYGYLLLIYKMSQDKDKYSGAWNFGPEYDSCITVRQLVERLIKSWGDGDWQDISGDKTEHEANYLKLDINKARSHLGWNPVLNIDDAIKYTVESYKYDENDYYESCLKIIDKFINMSDI